MARTTLPGSERDVENPLMLQTNGRDFLLLGSPNTSNYHGFWVKLHDEYYKILWNLLPDGELTHVDPLMGIRAFERGNHRMRLSEEGVHAVCTGRHVLTLDCKQLHDESKEGREYSLEVREPFDAGTEGDLLGKASLVRIRYENGYVLHVCIATTMHVVPLQAWRPVSYPYDDRRNSHSTRWVYDAVALEGEGRVAVAVALGEKEAEQRAFALLLKKLEHESCEPTPLGIAERALSQLRTPTGIMAGLPWFHKEWSRDELISCGGLSDYHEIIPILDKWYSAVRNDGSLPAIYPDEGLASADAPGWLGKRTLDVLGAAHSTGEELDPSMLLRWRNGAGRLMEAAQHRIRDGLVWSGLNETWMDTSWHDDGRAGYRIEIQALTHALCEAHAALCKIASGDHDHSMALGIIQGVHDKLVDGDVLLDGLHADGSADTVVRPNIFLAWYVAPNLFLPEQWKRFFGHALSELWLPWGGLSSISRHDQRYHARDTGEDSQAYHRGDSWYFVNNIAAMALHAVAPEHFHENVDAILAASVRDMMELGISGGCSEISSAEEQEPMGCHSQAWSASTLVELLRMLS